MISKRTSRVALAALLALALSHAALGAPGSWYFAVSGDSRDCGDLIMPKIAADVASRRQQTPAEFYWHLGDLRGMYRIDCDMLKRKYPNYDCVARPAAGLQFNDFNDYLKNAWDDFVQFQIKPFAPTPFVLGIGNHELINRTREDFECRFKTWLTQPPIEEQFRRDAKRGIPTLEDNTYFHFVRDGVDFIYLDNADAEGLFSPEELTWLARVLAADGKDKSVKTIIVGMHDALPLSSERGHAMDQTCKGFCSGMQAYDLLWDAQNLTAPAKERKHVYVLASHSHFFRENIYDTPEHKGRVLPGWIIGTGGAEQYKQPGERIQYGYMMVEVRADGTIGTQFHEVTRQSPPLANGPGAEELTSFCFELNRRVPVDVHQSNCSCPATK
ncbi:MAG: metallophosphoesterase family protein [Pyrinomonadaceae bacterium]